MSELPPTWVEVPFSAITVDASQRMPLAEEVIRYIDIGSVNRNTKSIESPQELLGKDAPSRARKQVAVGDTLVSMTRPNLNAVALVPRELDGQIASTGFDVLRPIKGIDPRWVSYLVRTDAFVEAMSDLVQGALYPAVRSKDVRAHVVPLAPQVEQTRIANQLDTLLARVHACNDRFDAIPALLKRFRQTVLDAATSGRLTEDWRGLDDLRQVEWKTVALQDVITEMRNGLAQKPTESPPGSKILRIGAVRSGQLNLDDHRYLVVSDKEAGQYALKQDDLLFTRYNGSLEFVGVCAALTHDAPGYVYPDKLIRVRVRADRAIAKFIEIVFGCRSMRTQVESFVKSSAGQRGVSGADLKAAKFSLPPIAEQTEIVRRVEALFALADRIEARCSAARTQAQRLTPLVLAKAFRGELVAQDPNDEPASALLARIASSNTAVAGEIKRKVPVVLMERAQAAINL
jgi:type I restriction enzyme S subunit